MTEGAKVFGPIPGTKAPWWLMLTFGIFGLAIGIAMLPTIFGFIFAILGVAITAWSVRARLNLEVLA